MSRDPARVRKHWANDRNLPHDPTPSRLKTLRPLYAYNFYPSVELRPERSSLQAVLALLKKCIVSTLGVDGVVNNDIVEVRPDPTQD